MREFRFYFRNVYGTMKIYPANSVAEEFAKLMQVKTFSQADLLAIEALGFALVQMRDPRAGIGSAA